MGNSGITETKEGSSQGGVGQGSWRGEAEAAWARAGDRVDVSRYGSQGRETGRKEEGGEEEKERDSGYGSKVIFVDNGTLFQIWD